MLLKLHAARELVHWQGRTGVPERHADASCNVHAQKSSCIREAEQAMLMPMLDIHAAWELMPRQGRPGMLTKGTAADAGWGKLPGKASRRVLGSAAATA